MGHFFTVLNEVKRLIYAPNNLIVQSPQEEKPNEKYGAGIFQLSGKSVRFRVANVTPKKDGQFVAFWERDENNNNQAYTYEDAPELLVIITSKDAKTFGQFVFPNEVLMKQNILRSSTRKGKMAMRVYPGWDHPSSKQARATQKWQLPYFIDLSNGDNVRYEKINQLYFGRSVF